MTGHHQLEPYSDIKASGSSEDSCYGSNDLSRSSSSAHGVSRPLLTAQDRSPSLSVASVEYAVPTPRQHSMSHLRTFHSPGHYNLKKTVQSLTQRPIVALQSSYLTYDTIDTLPNHSSPTSTTSREYSI